MLIADYYDLTGSIVTWFVLEPSMLASFFQHSFIMFP